VKTLDITDDHPPAIGQVIKITDREISKEVNSIELNWIMLIFGCVFTGLSAFFACLLTSFIHNETLKSGSIFSIRSFFYHYT
jgi:hypothetical protein